MTKPATSEHTQQPDTLADKCILVGVTGGIAAYKSAALVSALAQAGAQVHVLMTEAAQRFVTPLTFEALSGHAVLTSIWQQKTSHEPHHIKLATRAEAMLIAPATMDCLARLATGRADDIVSLLVSAIDRRSTPVLLAPAMNVTMWAQPATQRHVSQLIEDGFLMVGPAEGWQACRKVGPGRMSEPDEIIEALRQVCNHHGD